MYLSFFVPKKSIAIATLESLPQSRGIQFEAGCAHVGSHGPLGVRGGGGLLI